MSAGPFRRCCEISSTQNAKDSDDLSLRSETANRILATKCKSSDKDFRANQQTSHRTGPSRHPLRESRHAPRGWNRKAYLSSPLWHEHTGFSDCSHACCKRAHLQCNQDKKNYVEGAFRRLSQARKNMENDRYRRTRHAVR